LLAATAGSWIAAATVVAERAGHWSDGPVLGLLVAGGTCLLLAIGVLTWPQRRPRAIPTATTMPRAPSMRPIAQKLLEKQQAETPRFGSFAWALESAPGEGPAAETRRQTPATSVTERLTAELKEGYEIRHRTRMAKDREEMAQAVQEFIEWGGRVNQLVLDGATEHFSDFQNSRSPWALQGKVEVLAIMDERLRLHSNLIKTLRR
jgi:hypothetical protein